MSTICHGFIENAWRKDLCSNCFRTKEEHLALAAASKMYQYHQNHSENSSFAQNNWRNSHTSNGINSSNTNSATTNNNSVSINIRHHQNGLPPPPTTHNQYQQSSSNNTTNQQQQSSISSNYQSPSGIPRVTGKYGTSNGQNSRSSLYSCYETPNRERVNVTINNGNNNSNTRKPQAGSALPAIRSHQYYDDSCANSIKSSVNGQNAHNVGGVSVSVGRSSSYNHINNIGRTSASGLMHSSANVNGTGTGIASSANGSGTAVNYNYGNMNASTGTTSSNNASALTSASGLNHRRLAMTSSGGNISSNISARGGNGNSIVTSTGMNGTVAVVTNGNGNSNRHSVNGIGTAGFGNGNTPTPSARTITSGNGHGKTSTNQTQHEVQNQINLGSSISQNNNTNLRYSQGEKMTDSIDGEVQVTRRISVPCLDREAGKGILRKKEKTSRRKMSVTFPKEVVAVIGYGGETSDDESDEDPIPDPLDAVTVAEIMLRNSHTPLEKEVNRLTLKNTSFNSIKSNLNGYKPIIIEKIVGGTMGKSLETGVGGKPLISIGTFEARKEPLRIRKMGDDPINSNSIPKNTNTPITSMVTNNNNNNNNSNSNNHSIKNVNMSHNKVTETTVLKNTTKMSMSNVLKNNNNFSTSNGVTVNVVNAFAVQKSSSTSTGNSGGCVISTNAVQHPERIIPVKITQKPLSSECNNLRNQIHAPLASPRSSVLAAKTNERNEAQQSQLKSTQLAKSQSESLSNLIILNDGNIASKRISFLKDILKEEEQQLRGEEESEELAYLQLQAQLPLDSLEPTICQQQPSPPLTLKSEVNLEIEATPGDDIDQSVSEFARNNDLFDDSLEDSGLDIKVQPRSSSETRNSSTEVSESDTDKSGSNSDSGNENDFSERELLNPPKPKGRTVVGSGIEGNGLLRIACDLHTEDLPKSASLSSAKLSPDSVISSEVSEMSNSGSNESIPTRVLEEAENIPVPAPAPAPAPITKASSVIPPILKRLAPPPPRQPPPPLPIQHQEQPPPLPPPMTQQQRESVYTNEELYDDISARDDTQDKNQQRHRVSSSTSADNSLEEDLYDDCSIMANASGKVATGSYNFADSNDPDSNLGSDTERVPVKQNDGIEFIGIRKIDSESFLRNETTPPPASPNKEKSSSPKVKRKVNQFFSTIGKRAGAAFNRNHNHSQIEVPPGKFSVDKTSPTSSSSFSPFSYYKRSLSQDEVSMTRTQGIYATLSPTLLKARGGSGVLDKLSRLDLQPPSGSKDEDSKDKAGKNKSKFSASLKKFLRFGPKDGETNKYEFENANTGTSTSTTNPVSISATLPMTNNSNSNMAMTKGPPVLPKTDFRPESFGGREPMPEPPSDAWKQNLPPARPPPPPPRVHSLDLLNKIGDTGLTYGNQCEGTVKPARPPPPVRLSNNNGNAAPNFVSVFAGQDEQDHYQQQYEQERSYNQSQRSRNNHGHGHQGQGHTPNKPRRKASMRSGDAGYGDGGAYTANYLETTYNHITSLNFETLKLIASQTPARIRRSSNQLIKFNKTPLRWSQFYVTDVEPVCSGRGYCFYSAFWEDESCILLIQESLSSGIPPLEFECISNETAFEDIVPTQFVTWEASDYVNTGNGVKVFVSVLPSCTVQKLPGYLGNASVTPSRKFFALLQAMDFWGLEEMSDLLVFHQIPSPSSSTCDSGALSSKSKIQIPNFGLVYVASARLKSGSFQHASRANFEMSLKQLLFSSHPQGQNQGQGHLLCDNDRHILLRRICGSSEEVEAQLRLFVQLKLFGPQAGDLDKILRYRSEKQVTQWMDKERAFCMKDAIERTLQRNSEAISPLRKSFVEFLMISDNCAKAVLDFVVDLNPDL